MLKQNNHQTKLVLLTAVLVFIILILCFLSLKLGSINLSLSQLLTVAHQIQHGQATPISQIVLYLRIPRTIMAIICGAGLGMVGVLLQTVTRNDLADPFVFGLSSGAATGAVFVITVIGDVIGMWTLPLAAFVGAITSAAAVLFLVRKVSQQTATHIVLAGLAISFLFTAITNFLVFHGDQRAAQSILFWSLGGLGNSRWQNLPLTLFGLICLVAFISYKHRSLDCLLAGDDVAQSMGVNPKRLQTIVFIICAVATASFVSIIGVVGFIGLMVPHIAKKVVGPLHKRLLFASGLIGTLVMLLSDVLSRTLIPQQELPLGVITTAFGAVFIIFILIEKQQTL